MTHPDATICNPNATLTQPSTTENATLSLQNGNCINDSVKVDDGFSGTTFDRPDFMRMIADMENGKIGIIITKDLSRLGRDYLKTGQYIEMIFPDYDVRYIAINDAVDTAKSENELMAFKNIFNDWYARDTSKKIKAVFKAKGMSGKPLTTNPPYGYKKSETDKNQWIINDDTAPVVRKIFKLCIAGKGPSQIARILTEEGIPTPTAYSMSKNSTENLRNVKTYRWDQKTISGLLEKLEYCGHTVNFRTRKKSYKIKKLVINPKSEWQIFENTHEAIITQEDFDLVQKLRSNKRKNQKIGELNPFSGMVYCADCGSKMYVCRAKSLNADQEHLKCSTYAGDKEACSAHFIRTAVLSEIVIGEVNKVLEAVRSNREEFLKQANEQSASQQSTEMKRAKKSLATSEKRYAELDRLFARLYEDNVSGKISDERFEMLSKGYEDEQSKLKSLISELQKFIEKAEQKAADTTEFVKIVQRYERVSELTPEIMHELIERIIVHAPDKSSGHREQIIEINFRFNAVSSVAIADSRVYDKKRKAA